MNQSLEFGGRLAYELRDVPSDMRLRVLWRDGKKAEELKVENGKLVPANDPETMPYMDRKIRGL